MCTLPYVIDKKYITLHRFDGASRIKVTDAGRHAQQYHALLALKPVPQKKWDGLWRIVLFDIPNEMKTARDSFGALLKRLGFVRLQKSVFVCPHPCEAELEVVAAYFGIANFIEIIIASRFSHEKEFKQLFKLRC